MITLEELKQIMPYSGNRAETYLEHLNNAMAEYAIDTPQRQAAFLATIAHESGSLRYVEEIADGSAYEGREDLGNLFPGDGVRYKGRGLIQLTGRKNYEALTNALGADVLTDPVLLETPELACRSAAWFWRNATLRDGSTVDLNEYADNDDFMTVSKVINIGLIQTKIKPRGYGDRLAYYEKAQRVLA